MTPKDESPRSEIVQYATGEEWWKITSSPRMNEAGKRGYGTQLFMCLVMKVKSNVAKNSTS